MPVSILHVGLPLAHPKIPVADRPTLVTRLAALQQAMRDAGYDYEIVQLDPDSGLDGFKERLRLKPCDGVLIGGGVASDSEMTYFMELIVDAVHEAAPRAKIMFHSHAVSVRTTVERWFPQPAIEG
ncbi:hypothetical protein SAMN05421770_11085 [Granulicella rosea]|uniref:Uncharacterized protein n=1 Tax=Granulicella rosea TaxID=474952 RepID=A0A239M7X7_9BACT|nr:hypothetical protein SAMN05421770_11085 [Granulicella rosea]